MTNESLSILKPPDYPMEVAIDMIDKATYAYIQRHIEFDKWYSLKIRQTTQPAFYTPYPNSIVIIREIELKQVPTGSFKIVDYEPPLRPVYFETYREENEWQFFKRKIKERWKQWVRYYNYRTRHVGKWE